MVDFFWYVSEAFQFHQHQKPVYGGNDKDTAKISSHIRWFSAAASRWKRKDEGISLYNIIQYDSSINENSEIRGGDNFCKSLVLMSMSGYALTYMALTEKRWLSGRAIQVNHRKYIVEVRGSTKKRD
jgi:hypothetical protein